ncbi:MAG: radical SAM/SPASM domain-containing protein [Desulfobacterales bacterium]
MTRLVSLIPVILRNKRRIPNLPRLLTYLVTFRCNMRCIMCDSWKKDGTNDLMLDEIRSIFLKLPKMDVVRLTGGEPFLRQDLLAIAHAVQAILKPLSLHITTNGALTDRIIEFCEQRRKDAHLYLLVSIDGIGDNHNTIRGRRYVWERATRTIEALVPRQKELRLQIGINQTIVNEDGIKDYHRLKDYLKPLGIQNSIVFAYNESATYHQDHQTVFRQNTAGQFNSFGSFGDEQLRLFFAAVQKDLTDYPYPIRLAKQYYLKGIKNRLLHKTGFPNPKCVALSSHMRLMPDGSMPTCQFNSTSIGNLLHQNFSSAWFGHAIAKQRKWVNSCTGCWAECEILPNALYTGDIAGLIRK